MNEADEVAHCLTAAGMLILDDHVLLVRHRKLDIWLSPGGHIDPDELPHEAAEREFFEETGLRVRARRVGMASKLVDASAESEYVPNPIASNVHWINRENAQQRQQKEATIDRRGHMMKPNTGCEKHLGLLYLVEPVAGEATIDSLSLQTQEAEVSDIRWFHRKEIQDTELRENIRREILLAFDLIE